MSGLKVELVDLDPERPGVYASYIVDTGGPLAVVDVGPASTVERLAERIGGRPVHVFITHVHLDHAGGLGHLVREARVERVYVHPRGARHLVDPSRLWVASVEVLGSTALEYGEPLPVPGELIYTPQPGEEIVVGDVGFKVVAAEGHASHQYAYLAGDVLFPGDALGEVYGGDLLILTPPPFMAGESIATLDRFQRLKARVAALPHFGIHEDPGGLARRYKAKLLWALGLAAETGGAAELASKLLGDEETARALGELRRRRGHWEGYLERCANGLLGYVERFGWR